jgi:hypothetical protein
MAINIGDTRRVKANVKVEGVNTNAGTVRLHVRKPGAPSAITSTFGQVGQPYTITNPSPGNYEAGVFIDVAGKWLYEYEMLNPDKSEEGEFEVEARRTRG